MKSSSKTYRNTSILFWAFSVLALMVFSNVLAIQGEIVRDKFTSERIDSDSPTHSSSQISYQCAISILNKRNAPEQFCFMSLSREYTMKEAVNLKYQSQKKQIEAVAKTLQTNFLRSISHQSDSKYHS